MFEVQDFVPNCSIQIANNNSNNKVSKQLDNR